MEDQLLLQDAKPMKCLLLQDAGFHALILTSAVAHSPRQTISILKTVPTLKTVNTSAVILDAKLAEVATHWQLHLELAHVTPLNVVKVKFAIMDNAIHKIQISHQHQLLLQDAKPMKCLLRKDAGLHALILTSAVAHSPRQIFSCLKTLVPTRKTVNTSALILDAQLAKLETIWATHWQLQVELAHVTSLINVVKVKFAIMEGALIH